MTRGGVQLSNLHRTFGSWFLWVRSRFCPLCRTALGARTLCRRFCCRLRVRGAGREAGRGGGCSRPRAACAARAQDAAVGRSMLIPLSVLQSRNRPQGHGQEREVNRDGSRVPHCCRLILKEGQQALLNSHSGQEAAVEGRAPVSCCRGLCPSSKPHQERGEKRIFLASPFLRELHPL